MASIGLTSEKQYHMTGLLTNLAGVNSFHKLVIGLQAALRELTDKVAAITFKKFPRVSQEGVGGWADLNPPGKLIAEVIKSNW